MRLRYARLSLPQQPLLFVALAFIVGLLVAARFPVSVRAAVLCAVLTWVAASLALATDWIETDGGVGKWASTALLLAGCIASGCALGALERAAVRTDDVRRLIEAGALDTNEPVELIGQLTLAPELAPDRIYLRVAVENVAAFGQTRPASGAVQLAVPFYDDAARADYDALKLAYGVRVRALCFLHRARGYQNPGAPQFDELIEHQGLSATGWVKSPLLLERLPGGGGNRLLGALYRARARAVADCLRSFRQPTSGMLAAALFGNRHFLSRPTAELFRAGGTFHLLVISGLHVVMIALAVMWLARRLSDWRPLQAALVTVVMWAYALMVGAQPSITRAVVMLNIALLGQLIWRETLGVNTLAASALVLLAWQPRDLFNPGFQLSFLTVLMISAVAAPLLRRLQTIGAWRPGARTPYPPRVPAWLRALAETLYWDEARFRAEMDQARITYKLEKAWAGRALSRARWELPDVRGAWHRIVGRDKETIAPPRRGLNLQMVLRGIVASLIVTTAVQLGLLPLMLFHFHRVSIIAPLANIIESVLVSALMLAGALYLLLHAALGAWVMKLAAAVDWIGWLTIAAGEPLLRWRKASLRVPDFGVGWQWVFGGFCAAVIVLLIVLNEWHPLRKIGVARRKLVGGITTISASVMVLVLGWLLVVHPFEHDYARGRLSIMFLDVGQGDAMLVSFPRGRLLLLDSGGRPDFTRREKDHGDNEEVFIEDSIGIAEAAVMPALWRRGIRRLDWLVASHGDADHVEGFPDIARSFAIGAALDGLGASPDGTLEQAARAANVPLYSLKRGDAFEVDGVRVETLAPFADDARASSNNRSLVLRLRFGERAFLLTGDIEKETETRLAESESELRADVLKVAHHGSRTSSSDAFLARVAPQHAVISVAEPSPYGHPHAEALARLLASGAEVWRTSHCGALTISTDGRDLRVEPHIKCESERRSGDSGLRSSRALR